MAYRWLYTGTVYRIYTVHVHLLGLDALTFSACSMMLYINYCVPFTVEPVLKDHPIWSVNTGGLW